MNAIMMPFPPSRINRQHKGVSGDPAGVVIRTQWTS